MVQTVYPKKDLCNGQNQKIVCYDTDLKQIATLENYFFKYIIDFNNNKTTTKTSIIQN